MKLPPLHRLALLGLALAALHASGTPALADSLDLTPTYDSSYDAKDATWTKGADNKYTVATSAEVYEQELWERGVEAGGFTESGGVRTLGSTKEYWGYGDLEGGRFGLTTKGGKTYLTIQWDLVGGFKDESGTTGKIDSGEKLKGNYYFYFEKKSGGSPFMIAVLDGSGLDDGGSSQDYVDKVFLYGSKNAEDVYGSSITTTGENVVDGALKGTMEGFGDKISDTQWGRRNEGSGFIEVAIDISLFGGLSGLDDILWGFLGAAVSNPSDPGTDIFANDMYTNFTLNDNDLQYDTLKFGQPIPEPGTVGLMLLGIVGLGLARRRRMNRA